MRKPLSVLLAVALLAVAPSTVATQVDLGVPSKSGVVVSSSDVAADAGGSVLLKGGNALTPRSPRHSQWR
jgi:hypothetical protein